MTKQYSETIGDLARLTAALGANAADLPHLEGIRGRLEAILSDAQEAAKMQAALIASKQEATKKLQALTREGLRLAAGVNKLLQQNYGPTAEKLAELGLQPFRGRKPRKDGEPEAPAPSAALPAQP